PEVTVGLCLNRSIEMVIGILGILKAGGAYLPLDPTYPEERLVYMLGDAQISILLTQQHIRERYPEWATSMICLDNADETIWHEAETNPDARATLANLAYIIYTSGSTGNPKGVMLQHQGLLNYVSWCIKNYPVMRGQGAPLHSSIGFDLTITSLFPSLLVGQRVILLPEEQRVDALLQLSETDKQLNIIKITPAHLALLGQQVTPQKAKDLTGAFIIGGEALLEQDLRFWKTFAPDTKLINEYGPTEATVGCCTYLYTDNTQPDVSGSVPIGRPIRNMRLYIVDQHLSPVPVGVWGELYISGHGLARGYYNRPDLTAERFLPNPFARGSEPEYSRMYRTGDVVRYRADGTIEFRGRNDQQIKVRGFRIEAGEIETALRKHPAVVDAIVQASDTSHEAQLVGYVIGDPQTECTAAELQDFLRKQLPAYMIPAHITQLAAFPLTVHGKVDREQLLRSGSHQEASQRAHVPPRDMLEFQLVQIWEHVLKTRPIGVTDDFFTLGGHSFLVLQVMQRIEKQFGQVLPLITLFENPSIEHLADLLRQPTIANQSLPLVPIQTAGELTPLFLVHPIGGTVHCYLELARALGPDQPVYGFQAPGLQGETRALESVEEMATCYIAAMKSVQPAGPYRLGGWSMGGVVAFEMAQQLSRQGEQVEQLILLGSRVPLKKMRITSNYTELLTEFVYHLIGSSLTGISAQQNQQLPQLNIQDAKSFMATLNQLEQQEQLQLVFKQIKQLGIVPGNTDIEQFASLFAIFRMNYKVGRTYRPKAYAGNMIICSTEEELQGKGQEPSLGWRKLVKGKLRIYSLQGDHYSLIHRPNTQLLASYL
ncbi:MAG TPA: amino acid adenylation domain-containing protein, partial [Ktedonobacteraceae bacterium]|nr:amino acid adenylation domain-containing protein [Ktedonobacteraceae bacterium]